MTVNMSEISKQALELRTRLDESVRCNLTDGLLLSGGLDTTILAYLASKYAKPVCITVALKDAPAPDIEYAKLIVSRLELKHYIHYFDNQEVEDGIRAAIRIKESFDPMEIRNDAAIYIALKIAREQGLSTIMTGDASDELLGGYSFLFGLSREQLDAALKKLWSTMTFSSICLAKDMGIEARLPYMEPQFKAFATNLDVSLKVKNDKGQVWGKWILRKAFEDTIPQEITWRIKTPIEKGCGTTILPALFNSRTSDAEFNEKKQLYENEDRVKIRSKEHLFYYEIYKSMMGAPYLKAGSGRNCPDCGSNVKEGTSFCRICGAYPV